MNKQDLNGYRKPEDVARRFNLDDIKYNAEEIEKLKTEIICDDHLSNTSTNPVQNKVITDAINHKVNKVEGKGLSTNDFTDNDKQSIHTHDNKTVLDEITSQKVSNWDQMTIDYLYPVGYVYISKNNTDPGTVYTGTAWTMVSNNFTIGNETFYVWKRTS